MRMMMKGDVKEADPEWILGETSELSQNRKGRNRPMRRGEKMRW